MVRAHSRACALSVTPGNRRRNSTAAVNSPPWSKAVRMAAASASETTNIPVAWEGRPRPASCGLGRPGSRRAGAALTVPPGVRLRSLAVEAVPARDGDLRGGSGHRGHRQACSPAFRRDSARARCANLRSLRPHEASTSSRPGPPGSQIASEKPRYRHQKGGHGEHDHWRQTALASRGTASRGITDAWRRQHRPADTGGAPAHREGPYGAWCLGCGG